MKLFERNFDKPGAGIDPDALPKQGLERFFEILILEYQQIIPLSLLYMVSCLPVFTIPAATAALSGITLSMVEDKPRFLVHDFFYTFWKEFKRAELLGGFYLLAILVTGFGAWFYRLGSRENPILLLPFFFMAITSLLLIAASFYAYPMLVLTRLPLKVIFRNSGRLLMVKGSGIRILGVFFIEGILCLCGFLCVPWTLLLFPFGFLGIQGLVGTFGVYKMLKAYVLIEKEV